MEVDRAAGRDLRRRSQGDSARSCRSAGDELPRGGSRRERPQDGLRSLPVSSCDLPCSRRRSRGERGFSADACAKAGRQRLRRAKRDCRRLPKPAGEGGGKPSHCSGGGELPWHPLLVRPWRNCPAAHGRRPVQGGLGHACVHSVMDRSQGHRLRSHWDSRDSVLDGFAERPRRLRLVWLSSRPARRLHGVRCARHESRHCVFSDVAQSISTCPYVPSPKRHYRVFHAELRGEHPRKPQAVQRPRP